MNDALRQAAEVDPKWAQSEQRKSWLLKIVTAGALMAIAVGTVALVLGIHNSTEITKVTQKVNSSCAQVAEHPVTVPDDVRGECEHIRQAIAKGESLVGPCILHQRATGTKGANCRKVYVPLNGASSSPSSGGDASQPGSTGSQPSSPPAGGHGAENAPHTAPHHTPSHKGSEHPGAGASNPADEAPPGVSETPPQAEAPAAESAPPDSHPSHPETPAPKAPVRETVGAAGETVNGALEGVGHTECKLLGCKNP